MTINAALRTGWGCVLQGLPSFSLLVMSAVCIVHFWDISVSASLSRKYQILLAFEKIFPSKPGAFVLFHFTSHGFSWRQWWWSQLLCDDLEKGKWLLWNTTHHEVEAGVPFLKSEWAFGTVPGAVLGHWCYITSRGKLSKDHSFYHFVSGPSL